LILRTEILFLLLHPVSSSLVRAGIGFDRRAVQRYPAHFQRARFQRDLQNLLEESLLVFKWILRKSDMVRMFG